jgi:predicted N-acetyltransferase YhbS
VVDALIIRSEKPSEFRLIYDLVKVAFQTAQVSNGQEQDFVNRLRAGNGYIPQLALVSEQDGQIIGHIMLTKTTVSCRGLKHEVLLLAPLAVALEHRGCGVGSQLIMESFTRAKNLGYQAVLVVGNPAYYARFGFKPSVSFGITHNPPIPDPYVMACELVPHALSGVSGTVSLG